MFVVYRLLVYGRKIEPAAGEHRILGRMVHVQVLDGVRGAHPGSGDEERDAQPVVHLRGQSSVHTATVQWREN